MGHSNPDLFRVFGDICSVENYANGDITIL